MEKEAAKYCVVVKEDIWRHLPTVLPVIYMMVPRATWACSESESMKYFSSCMCMPSSFSNIQESTDKKVMYLHAEKPEVEFLDESRQKC